jgi:uridylate kinase
VSYQEVIEKELRVMDTSAISLCRENKLPILVFNMIESGNIIKVVNGDLTIGTLVNE